MQQDTLTRRIQVLHEDSETNIYVDGVFAGGWDSNIPNEDLPYYCNTDDCKWLVNNGEGDPDVASGWHELKTCECEDWSECSLNEKNYEEYFPWFLNQMINDYFCEDVDFEHWNENMSTDELIDEVNAYFGSDDWNDHWDYIAVER